MKINSRKLRVKVRSLKKPKVVMAVAVVIVIFILTSGVAVARYSLQNKSAKKPANQLVAHKTEQATKPKTNTPSNAKSNISSTGSTPNSKTQLNPINPKCLQASEKSSFIAEQKRHLDKLKELREYWLKNGGLSTDGYKNDLLKENDTNRQNMLDLTKPTKQSIEKLKC